jgi:7-cyano-7-deazaguanine synthase
MTQEKALVLFSGGQDSATCLVWALDRFAQVEAIGFDYGQRHKIELEVRDAFRTALLAARPEWRAKLGADHLIRLDALGQVSDTALTSDATIAFNADGLPNPELRRRHRLSPRHQAYRGRHV